MKSRLDLPAIEEQERGMPAWFYRTRIGLERFQRGLLLRPVKAGDKLFIAGPPDLIDEDQTFQRLVGRDPRVAAKLAEQDAALDGKHGGVLHVVAASDGSQIAEYKLSALPVWDGLAAANGRLYLAATNGSVICLGE